MSQYQHAADCPKASKYVQDYEKPCTCIVSDLEQANKRIEELEAKAQTCCEAAATILENKNTELASLTAQLAEAQAMVETRDKSILAAMKILEGYQNADIEGHSDEENAVQADLAVSNTIEVLMVAMMPKSPSQALDSLKREAAVKALEDAARDMEAGIENMTEVEFQVFSPTIWLNNRAASLQCH